MWRCGASRHAPWVRTTRPRRVRSAAAAATRPCSSEHGSPACSRLRRCLACARTRRQVRARLREAGTQREGTPDGRREREARCTGFRKGLLLRANSCEGTPDGRRQRSRAGRTQQPHALPSTMSALMAPGAVALRGAPAARRSSGARASGVAARAAPLSARSADALCGRDVAVVSGRRAARAAASRSGVAVTAVFVRAPRTHSRLALRRLCPPARAAAPAPRCARAQQPCGGCSCARGRVQARAWQRWGDASPAALATARPTRSPASPTRSTRARR